MAAHVFDQGNAEVPDSLGYHINHYAQYLNDFIFKNKKTFFLSRGGYSAKIHLYVAIIVYTMLFIDVEVCVRKIFSILLLRVVNSFIMITLVCRRCNDNVIL